ncbi:MAG TPA: helix-turn-helix transcriptional regulator [Gaiellaceae bacterium]|nr:helix-turn-helix transcriptional regulator [Gaiellaceae bacterium]
MALRVGAPSAGALLREWRQRRNLSQLELALRSAISARHLSFIETGRAQPSREMILHLAERLDVPLRDRNRLLLAAGFAPVFGERSLEESDMAPVREALERFLAAHEPYPAVVVDRHWNVVAFNRGVAYVNHNVAPELRTPPANALRIALHPDGLSSQISNLTEWSGFLLARLRREIEATGDPELEALYEELAAYPGVTAQEDHADLPTADEIMLKHELRLDDTDLALFCTFTTFGTARDLTLAELSIVAFYPANTQTAEALTAAVGQAQLG